MNKTTLLINSGILCVALILVLLAVFKGKPALKQAIGLWTVWGVWAAVTARFWWLYIKIARQKFVTKHGISVYKNGHKVTKAEVEAVTEEFYVRYPWTNGGLNGVSCKFDTFPFYHQAYRNGKAPLSGLAWQDSKQMIVGLPPSGNLIKDSAWIHEAGHIMFGPAFEHHEHPDYEATMAHVADLQEKWAKESW